MADSPKEMNVRSGEILRTIVDAYIDTGEPVGSRTLSQRLQMTLSPATIRNVMADLEDAGLLYAPHTSAGRLPTEAGIRFFVNGLLEIGSPDLSPDEQADLAAKCTERGHEMQSLFEEVTATLSDLSRCASLVCAPKTEYALKHIELVPLGDNRALVVLVPQRGTIENRILELPPGLPIGALKQATHDLNAHLSGSTLNEIRQKIDSLYQLMQTELHAETRLIVDKGLGTWLDDKTAHQNGGGTLIVKGHAHLLDDPEAIGQMQRLRDLFQLLEEKESMLTLLDAVMGAESVQIFIGAETPLFHKTHCALVAAPFSDSQHNILGAIGIVGPTRMNYGRIIPMVDYTAKLLRRLLTNPPEK